MVLSSTSVLAVDWAPNNGCHQCLWPQGEFWLPPASPGASLRSTSLFWPSFLSNYFFCPESQSLWDVCVCVHMCAPFNSPLALRSYLPGAHHPVEGTQVGSPLWGWSPQSLGIASAIVIILPFVVCLPRAWVFSKYCISAPLTCLILVPSLYLELQKIFSTGLQIILIDICSVKMVWP